MKKKYIYLLIVKTMNSRQEEEKKAVKLSSSDSGFQTAWIIAACIIGLVWIGLVIWGFISYSRMAKRGTAPKGAVTGSIASAVIGIFFPLVEVVPISLNFVYR